MREVSSMLQIQCGSIFRKEALTAAFLLCLLFPNSAFSQVFGTPDDEQRLLAPINIDINEILKSEEKIKQLTRDIWSDPKSNSAHEFEGKRNQSDLLNQLSEDMFTLKRATRVVIEALAIALKVPQGARGGMSFGYHFSAICFDMPGVGLTGTAHSNPESSIAYLKIARRALKGNMLVAYRNGVKVISDLQIKYDALCERLMREENWK